MEWSDKNYEQDRIDQAIEQSDILHDARRQLHSEGSVVARQGIVLLLTVKSDCVELETVRR